MRRRAPCLLLTVFLAIGWNPAIAAETERAHEPASSVPDLRAGVRTVLDDAQALITAPLRMDGRDWLITGGVLVATGAAFAADKPLSRIMERNQQSGGRDTANAVGTIGSAEFLLALNAGMIGLGALQESQGSQSRLKQTGLISLEAELFSVAAAFALKQATGRSRPDRRQGATDFHPFNNGSGSFVSTHAAASFAVASVLADRYEYGWLAYGAAGAVAASRVYTLRHFSSDMVAGAAIGWGIGRFLSRRHADDESWRLQPAQLLDGTGMGLAIGRRF